jgi:hypothetical protein
MTAKTLHGTALAADLDAQGWAATGRLITDGEAAELAGAFDDDARYRSRIQMSRYRYGEGDYAYFAYPLPASVERLREDLYAALAPIANDWASRAGDEGRWPDTLDAFLARCHAAGQRRPTPLVLRYGSGGYNALHQDRYGPVAFPLQVVVGLTTAGIDYTGGDFVLAEQRPRQQTRVTAIPLEKGHGVVFPNVRRPVPRARGTRRAAHRHGASTVRSGHRVALGIIFHDAE